MSVDPHTCAHPHGADGHCPDCGRTNLLAAPTGQWTIMCPVCGAHYFVPADWTLAASISSPCGHWQGVQRGHRLMVWEIA